MTTLEKLLQADKDKLQVFDLLVLQLLAGCDKPIARKKLQAVIDGSGTRHSVSRTSLAIARLHRLHLIKKTTGDTTCGLDLSLTPKGYKAAL